MMMHQILASPSFYRTLLDIDHDLARAARQARCPCGGALHTSNYPRRPRIGPAALPQEYDKRLSFCCEREGCRKRTTPPSVRFLGRRWYLAPLVIVFCALQYGPSPRRLRQLRGWLGDQLSRQTVERWRRWWQKDLPQSPLWKARRARFVPPPEPDRLPLSLLERFGGSDLERLIAVLSFLSPVTTSSQTRLLLGPQRR